MKNWANFVLSFILVGLLASCQTTRELSLPHTIKENSKVAIMMLPNSLDLISVDNLEVSLPMFAGSMTTVTIGAGRHEIILRYSDMLADEYNENRVVKSDYLSVVADFNTGGRYLFDFKEPETYEQGIKFVENPVISLVDSSTKVGVAVKPTGFTIGKTEIFGKLFANSGCVDSENVPCGKNESALLKDLKDTWSKASPSEKDSFREFIKGHP